MTLLRATACLRSSCFIFSRLVLDYYIRTSKQHKQQVSTKEKTKRSKREEIQDFSKRQLRKDKKAETREIKAAVSYHSYVPLHIFLSPLNLSLSLSLSLSISPSLSPFNVEESLQWLRMFPYHFSFLMEKSFGPTTEDESKCMPEVVQ